MKFIVGLFALMLVISTSHAAVKRHISVKKPITKDNGVSFTIEFYTSFNQDYPIQCDLIGKKKRAVRASKIDKKRYRLFGIGKPPKKIRCYYWLK